MVVKSYITARYAETDQMGIVHHSVYPIWFEVGRTDFIKQLGITYSQLEKEGVMLPLSSLSCKYLAPVHYEDEIVLETRVTQVSAAKIEFRFVVRHKDSGIVAAEGMTLMGIVSTETFRPINLKKVRPQLFERLKAACCGTENCSGEN